MRYYPKRPVKSFQDLEVYQKTLAIAVEIVKRVAPLPELTEVASKKQKGQGDRVSKDRGNIGTGTSCSGLAKTISEQVKHSITTKLIDCVLRIPLQIATAHSIRFGDSEQSIRALEKAMLNCNLAVVYLEQYRDLCNVPLKSKKRQEDRVSKDRGNIGTGTIKHDFFEEQIKEYLRVRYKIMHLQKSWLRFMKERKKDS